MAISINPFVLIVFAVLFLGVFFATRNRKTRPSLYTMLVCCAIAAGLVCLVVKLCARVTA
jgi:hypothetical protein